MPRADLLALEAEDLAVLANRGIVKRAHAEVDSGDYTCEIEEQDGAVTVRWSDEVECRIPAGKGLADGFCSCPATTLCRHLVRSVLAYQRQGAPAPEEGPHSEEEADEPSAPTASRRPWDPGSIPDEVLERHYRKPELARARREFEEGHVVELVRSVKPIAYVHTLSLNVRFLVPGEPAYTHCDCTDPRPCRHVPLAVWAFRMLPAEREGGLVSTRRESLPLLSTLLEEVEGALKELAIAGVQGAPKPLADRLRRLEGRCRDEGLVWPAEILGDLVQQQEAYWSHDARFSPRRVAELASELCIRMDAARADTGAVPQLFVRGSRADRVTDVGRAQMVGLGCGARIGRGGVELAAYLQDDRSGAVVAVCREFPDPPAESGEPPKDLYHLARTPAMTGVSLAALGAGRLQIEGGKRSPSSRFLPGRSRASISPHTLQWEKLIRAPVLAEDFAELAARLAAQPPASLRPRRVGSRLHVCPVAEVEGVAFSEADQTIFAALRDASGGTALLAHPYVGRARHGAELLLDRLRQHGQGLRFVAGEASLSGGGVMLHPISAVFEVEGARTLVQPWVEGPAAEGTQGASISPADASAPTPDPITAFPEELMHQSGEQWLLGFQRTDERTAAAWRALAERGSALGFHRLVLSVERVSEELEARRRTVRWDAETAAGALLDVGVLALISGERVGAAG